MYHNASRGGLNHGHRPHVQKLMTFSCEVLELCKQRDRQTLHNDVLYTNILSTSVLALQLWQQYICLSRLVLPPGESDWVHSTGQTDCWIDKSVMNVASAINADNHTCIQQTTLMLTLKRRTLLWICCTMSSATNSQETDPLEFKHKLFGVVKYHHLSYLKLSTLSKTVVHKATCRHSSLCICSSHFHSFCPCGLPALQAICVHQASVSTQVCLTVFAMGQHYYRVLLKNTPLQKSPSFHNTEATIGPIVLHYNVCVYGWCIVWEPCTVFSNAPRLILASFAVQSHAGCPCHGRLDCTGTPVKQAGSRPATQRTAHSLQPAWFGKSVSTSGADSDQMAL